MPLDTSIARSLKPLKIQFRDLGADYNQLAQMQSADTQNQLAQMQMSAAQRAAQEEEGAKNFLSGNPDLSTPENQRRLLAFGKIGLAYGKAIADQQKSKGEADKTAAEVLGLNQKNFTALNPPIRAAAGGIPGITDYVKRMYADPVLGALAKKIKTEEQALKENIEMYTKDADQWVTAHSNLEGAQMLDALKMSRERADEAARIASRMPPAAAPVAPPAAVAPPEMFVTQDSSGRSRYVVNGAEVTPEEYQNLQRGVMAVPVLASKLTPSPLPAVDNNLAAQVAPVANVNAINPNVATMQAIDVERTRLETDRNRLLNLRQSKGVQDELKGVEAQLKEINAPVNLRAEGTAFIPGRGMLTAAPTMTETQKEQAIFDDPKSTPAQKAVAVGRIAKLNNIPENAVPALIQEYEYAQKNNGYKGSLADFKVLSTPKTKIEVNAGEKAEEVAFRQLLVKQYEEVSARANVAAKSIPNLEINLKILDKGFDTGFGTETIAAGAKVLAALGVQNAKDFATDAQTFLANANSAVLQKQLEQKGVQTATDAARIESTGAQLGNTKEANKFILSVAKAQLQRDVAQRKFYSDWREENKTFSGAEDAWYAGPGGASLFDSPILKKYAEPVAGQADARKTKLDEIFKKAP
jgi:hypothetical protein